MSQEDILKSMNSRLTLPENQTEGTFGQDILGSVAYELDNTIELKVNTLLDRAFALTAYGDDLDRVGEDNDVYRKLEQPAKVLVTITGTPGIAVETNVQIEYADLIFKSIQNKIALWRQKLSLGRRSLNLRSIPYQWRYGLENSTWGRGMW